MLVFAQHKETKLITLTLLTSSTRPHRHSSDTLNTLLRFIKRSACNGVLITILYSTCWVYAGAWQCAAKMIVPNQFSLMQYWSRPLQNCTLISLRPSRALLLARRRFFQRLFCFSLQSLLDPFDERLPNSV